MSEKEMVLSFDGGHVEGMYFDDFPLDFLEGAIHITRATDIRFNETTQDWEIVLIGQDEPVSNAVKGFKKYEEARKFEVLWLQTCRKREINPDTPDGEAVAAAAREQTRLNNFEAMVSKALPNLAFCEINLQRDTEISAYLIKHRGETLAHIWFTTVEDDVDAALAQIHRVSKEKEMKWAI